MFNILANKTYSIEDNKNKHDIIVYESRYVNTAEIDYLIGTRSVVYFSVYNFFLLINVIKRLHDTYFNSANK